MDLYSNNLIVILVANLLIFFASFLSLFFLRKNHFILFKKIRLHEVEKKLNESNISNIFKERLIEIYHFLNIEKDSNSISNSIKTRLKPLVGFNDIKFFYRLKASQNLKDINSKLWDIEDGKRNAEKNNDFGDKFVELARNVYKFNDERAKIKLKINNLLGSRIKEVKSYE